MPRPLACRASHVAHTCRRGLSLMLALLVFSSPARAQPPAPRVSVLVYHRFAASVEDSMTVRVSTFEAQVRFLKERGYRFVPLGDVVNWLGDAAATLPSRSVVITVDDGHRSVFDQLLPIAQREHLAVTLFVYPSAISNAPYALTWNQLRTLRESGLFDVQSHTYWHPNFNIERRRRTSADFRQFVRMQLETSRRRIETQLGGKVTMLAWPFGIYDEELMTLAAEEGYVAGFSLEARSVDRHSRMLALPRFLIVDSHGVAGLAALLGEPAPPPNGNPGGN